MPDLQRQALLQVARADADRIEALQQLQRALDFFDRPRPHARDLVDRRHQVAVVVEVADDGFADLAHQLVVGLDRELPAEVIGQRAAGRQRVLDRRQLFDFLRRLAAGSRRRDTRRRSTRSPGRPRCRSSAAAVLLFFLGGLRLGGLQIFGRDLFEQRVFDDLLIEQIRQLQRRHRQQLDGLLQRWRQNQLLRQFRLQLLLNRHVRLSHASAQGMSRANIPS